MNHKFTLLFFITVLFVSCNEEKDIEIAAQSFTEKELSICQNNECPEITINYVEVFGNEKISEKINKKLDDFIFSTLLMGEDSIPTAKTINEAASDFVKAYRADKAEFPDMAGEYFAEIAVNEIYTTPKHICFELIQYLYTGGAHGYGTTSFLNIDPETGNELTQNQLFVNKEELTNFAEKKFRKQQHIGDEESINATGYWFEDDKFYLPESTGFTKDSLIFIYNQYDIASYADGPIELKIALKEAEPFLSID
ncbi:DUF3298 and DUF4163 domain-containing protein [Aequorivita marina]|uniref:DUF3298 and DUF4163 domain-containing protein n=1 Tax=Aequorivita marina TaxID=3073654 RepID=UPI002875DD71|nr:DUF3298 domain-containing protein [Aequorivita sp. S2608]MDS1298865.1 DUF4163 domain-containing protein [Aequorivita sp. S2608]